MDLLYNPITVGFVTSFLMFSDLYLTRFSYRLYLQGYHQYFTLEVFELNPRYQTLIHGDLPIPVKEILLRIALGILCGIIVLFVSSASSELMSLYEVAIGFILLGYFTLNLTHMQNIALFNYVKNNSEGLSGNLQMRADYSYFTSIIRNITNILLWLMVFILLNQLFFLGGALFGLFMALRWRGLGKHFQQKGRQEPTISSVNDQSITKRTSENTQMKLRYCIKCGSEISNEAKYCIFCGAQLPT